MQLARRILFYVFIFTYLVLCPLIILYSLGYIFQPEKKDISHTGLMYIATAPTGAYVYLGKSQFIHKTPVSIGELEPRQYQVGVRLKDYRPWDHEITIKPGKAAAFDHILLLPKKLNKTNLSPQNTYTHLTAIRGTDYFIVQKGARLKDYYVYNWKHHQLTPLVNELSEYKDFAVNSIYTKDKSKILIVFGGSLWNKKYFFISIDAKNHPLTEITGLFPQHPVSVIWDNDNAEDVFTVYDGYLNRLDFNAVSIYPKYIDDVKGFGLSDRWLYALETNNSILKLSFDKEQKTILFDDPYLGKDLFEKSQFYYIKKLQGEIILFWGDKGDLITIIPPYRISDGDVAGMEYDVSDNTLVYWTKNNIWTADFDINQEQTLFKDRAQLNNVYSKGANISQCFWVYDASHILLKDKNDVYLLELLPDKQSQLEYLLQVKDKTDIFYSETSGSLYYLDEGGI